jgi:integrase
MPYIHSERHGNGVRQVYRRRFPVDVQPVAGKLFIHKWPQTISRQEANNDTSVPEAFNQRVAESRVELKRRALGLTMTVGRIKGRDEDPQFIERCVVAAEIIGATSLHFSGERAYLVDITAPKPLVASGAQVAEAIGEASVDLAPFTPEEAIDLWVLYRKGRGKDTTDDNRARVLSKLDRLFDFLGHRDMHRVTEDHLNRYVEKTLLGKWSASTVRDHIIMLKAVFLLAFKRKRIADNPASALEYQRQTGNEREDFSKQERAAILRAASDSDNPVVKWSNLLAGFSGARIAEIVEADTRDVVVEDGELIFFVRTTHRVGDEKTLKTRTSKRWFVIHSAIRDEFATYVASLPPGPLFPDVKPYGGRRAKAASMIVANWLRDVVKIDQSKSFHSWRHTVKTMLQAKGVPDRFSDWITGHAGPANVAKRYLHPKIEEVAAAIETLDRF